MIRAYQDLVSDAKGIVRAQVTLAEAPSDAVLNEIKAALEDINKEPGRKTQMWKVDGFNDN